MTFRADRIRSAIPGSRDYEIPDGFEVAAYRHQGPPSQVEAGLTVAVSFDPGIARFARETFPAREFVDGEDGSVTATLKTSGTAWLVSELLRWGGGAVVVDPPEIRRELMERARETLARYGEEA